jgi:uncharacterized protein YciI
MVKYLFKISGKYTFIITLISVILLSCNNTDGKKEEASENFPESDTTFQSLNKEYGADDYGMKTYVMAFLKNGLVRDQDSATISKIHGEHLDNIKRLAESGKLLLAGPFLNNDELRGIYIFNVSSIEEARALTETDPAVNSGRLEMELHLWYGTAALQEVNEIHKKIAKKSI